MSNLIEQLVSIRREASLDADEVATIDRAIAEIDRKTALAAEYLELLTEAQQRHTRAMDALFLDRKRMERAIREVLGLTGSPGPRAIEILTAAITDTSTDGSTT